MRSASHGAGGNVASPGTGGLPVLGALRGAFGSRLLTRGVPRAKPAGRAGCGAGHPKQGATVAALGVTLRSGVGAPR